MMPLLGWIGSRSPLLWWGLITIVSVFGCAIVLAWDWFIYVRLPFVRWRMSQPGQRGGSLVRELMRVRKRKVNGPSDDPTGAAESPDG